MAKRRRQLIVDRSFQFKYTILIAVIGGAISAIFGAWMLEAARTSSELLILADIPGGESLQEEIHAGQANLPWIYLGITLLMMAALGLLGVLITHRVAGPAYIMSRYLNMLADGTYPSLRPLRKRDELQDFFDSFERAIVTLKERERSEAESLEKVIEALSSKDIEPETIEILAEIRKRKIESIAKEPSAEQSESSLKNPQNNEE